MFQYINDFKMKKEQLFNSLPNIKWKRLEVDNFLFPKIDKYNRDFLNSKNVNLDNIDIKNIVTEFEIKEDLKKYLDVDNFNGVAEKLVTFTEAFYNSGFILNLKKNENVKDIIYIKYEMDKENPMVLDHNVIIADEDSKVNIIMDYTNVDESKTFHNGVTKVFAHENATVNIFKIQRMNNESENYDSNIAFVKYGASVNWVNVEIGSSISASSYINNLEETESQSNIDAIYFGDKDRKLDLGYNMIHKGVKSSSRINCKGALKDKSKKIFRGNLDFKKGCKKSRGEEAEYVILLDPTAQSDAIPALLCEEDDVKGEHAASAGQIHEGKLYYLMSRGLSEKEAKKLIIESSFNPIIEKIPNENLRREIHKEVDRRIMDYAKY